MNTKRPSIQNNSLKKKHIEIRSSRSRISSSKNMNIKSIITRSNKKKSFKERKMIFLQKTQKQAEARLFNLIFESSPKVGSWIPTIFQILLTFFQTSFIHSNHLTKLYFQTLPDPLQLKKSFLNPNSIFNILSDSFNILTHTRKMGTYSIYFNLILLLTLLNLIYFILKKFSKISKFINFDLDNLKDSFLIKILSIILTNYNFFFFLGNILAVNSSFCREVTFKVTTGFQSGSNYLDSSYSSEYLEIAQTNLSTTFYKKKVSFLNDNAECGSFQYYSIAGLSWTLVVTNILLKHYSMKLMTFLPNFESSCTKLCNVDIFVDLIFLLILILKTLFISYLSHDIGKFQILNWINLALLLVCYTILTRNSIYYDLYFSRLKSFQIVYLVCLTAFGIFARETRLGSNMNESSTIVLFFVIMSLLLKFDHNLRKKIQLNEDENFEKRIFEVNQSSVEAQSLLYLYYQIISYISFWVRREKNLAQAVPGKITRTQFILGNLLNVHKQSCRKLVCFCKNSKHFQKISNIGFLKECTQKDLPLVFESLYIMQETFELFFKKNSLKENQIFNCYVYFLLNYFGSPKKAFKIMQKAINEKKSRGKSKSVREIQVYALFEQYNLVARKNIRNGILGLVKLINEFPDFEKKDKNEFSDMCEYFNFVQKFEELKLRVRRCFEFKLEFLDFLSRKKRVEIGKIMKISTKFCKEKIKVEERFEELDKITRMRYSPLYLTYGFYLNNITQEVSKGQRIMKKFQKISNLKNFIQAFNTSHKLKKVKMVIMLAEIGNQPGTQILKYSTTNCFELLGKKSVLI